MLGRNTLAYYGTESTTTVLGWKWLSETNTLDYYGTKIITNVLDWTWLSDTNTLDYYGMELIAIFRVELRTL